MLGDVGLHIYGGNFLVRANKCFEKGTSFLNLPKMLSELAVGTGECWGTGQVLSGGDRWLIGCTQGAFKAGVRSGA